MIFRRTGGRRIGRGKVPTPFFHFSVFVRLYVIVRSIGVGLVCVIYVPKPKLFDDIHAAPRHTFFKQCDTDRSIFLSVPKSLSTRLLHFRDSSRRRRCSDVARCTQKERHGATTTLTIPTTATYPQLTLFLFASNNENPMRDDMSLVHALCITIQEDSHTRFSQFTAGVVCIRHVSEA